MQIIAEQPEHSAAIEALLDIAFGGTRAAKTVYRLREGVAPIGELGFVAVQDGARQGDCGNLSGGVATVYVKGYSHHPAFRWPDF